MYRNYWLKKKPFLGEEFAGFSLEKPIKQLVIIVSYSLSKRFCGTGYPEMWHRNVKNANNDCKINWPKSILRDRNSEDEFASVIDCFRYVATIYQTKEFSVSNRTLIRLSVC
jgi:hypothetical protein